MVIMGVWGELKDRVSDAVQIVKPLESNFWLVILGYINKTDVTLIQSSLTPSFTAVILLLWKSPFYCNWIRMYRCFYCSSIFIVLWYVSTMLPPHWNKMVHLGHKAQCNICQNMIALNDNFITRQELLISNLNKQNK